MAERICFNCGEPKSSHIKANKKNLCCPTRAYQEFQGFKEKLASKDKQIVQISNAKEALQSRIKELEADVKREVKISSMKSDQIAALKAKIAKVQMIDEADWNPRSIARLRRLKNKKM